MARLCCTALRLYFALTPSASVSTETNLAERQRMNTNRPYGEKNFHYKEYLEFEVEKDMFTLHEAMYRLLDAIKARDVDMGLVEEQIAIMNKANQDLAMTGRGIEFPKVKTVRDVPNIYSTILKTYARRKASNLKGTLLVDVVLWEKYLKVNETLRRSGGYAVESRLFTVKKEAEAAGAYYTYCDAQVRTDSSEL
eukprot:TRINITY_DN46860_c0_g1_i1.p1 TRINITY_DN46860_c0_g1~~TRINITY_DN46860_c0_g1_i1.p1  ORF type:complete len:195 (-),score=36.92 TRINITY_DN46860_c0_g1_i1:110-694(-)